MVNLMTLERRGAIDFGSIFLLPFLDGYPIRARTRVDIQKEKFYLEIMVQICRKINSYRREIITPL